MASSPSQHQGEHTFLAHRGCLIICFPSSVLWIFESWPLSSQRSSKYGNPLFLFLLEVSCCSLYEAKLVFCPVLLVFKRNKPRKGMYWRPYLPLSTPTVSIHTRRAPSSMHRQACVRTDTIWTQCLQDRVSHYTCLAGPLAHSGVVLQGKRRAGKENGVLVFAARQSDGIRVNSPGSHQIKMIKKCLYNPWLKISL